MANTNIRGKKWIMSREWEDIMLEVMTKIVKENKCEVITKKSEQDGVFMSKEQLKTMHMLLSNCIFAEEEGYISNEDVSVLYNKQDKMLWDLSDMLEIDGNDDFFNINTLDLYTIE